MATEHEPISWPNEDLWESDEDEGYWVDEHGEPAEPSLPVTAPMPSVRPVRVARLPVTAEQDLWLRTVCAASLADGTRLSEATVLRLALDRLRAGGSEWADLQADLAAETKARTRPQRRPASIGGERMNHDVGPGGIEPLPDEAFAGGPDLNRLWALFAAGGPSVEDRPTFAERVSRVQLRTDQEAWVRRLLSEAMAAGDHVAEADVLRVALDRLRAGGAGWSELREAVAVETSARTQRRGR